MAGTDVCKHVVRDVATGGNSSPVLLTQPLPVKISPSRPPVVGVVVVYFFIESLPAVLVLLECSYFYEAKPAESEVRKSVSSLPVSPKRSHWRSGGGFCHVCPRVSASFLHALSNNTDCSLYEGYRYHR